MHISHTKYGVRTLIYVNSRCERKRTHTHMLATPGTIHQINWQWRMQPCHRVHGCWKNALRTRQLHILTNINGSHNGHGHMQSIGKRQNRSLFHFGPSCRVRNYEFRNLISFVRNFDAFESAQLRYRRLHVCSQRLWEQATFSASMYIGFSSNVRAIYMR